MVRSGNDPPVFRVPRNGERPVFWPLCGNALKEEKEDYFFNAFGIVGQWAACAAASVMMTEVPWRLFFS